MKSRHSATLVVTAISVVTLAAYLYSSAGLGVAQDVQPAPPSTDSLRVFTYEDPTMLGFFDPPTGHIYIYHEAKLYAQLQLTELGEDLELIKGGIMIRENGKLKRIRYPDGTKWPRVQVASEEARDDDDARAIARRWQFFGVSFA